MTKAAVYAATRNLYRDLLPSLKSLLMHSDVERVYLLIEDPIFPYTLPPEVETLNVSRQTYFRRNGPNWDRKWTWMVLMRAALPFLFPDLDRILSLDCDTIVTEDISDLWDLPIDSHAFAAAREPQKCLYGSTYTNVGVCLYNLRYLRESGRAAEVVDALNTRRFTFCEQDCLNELCRGEIYDMPSEFNACDFTDRPARPRIIHYAAIRDWARLPLVNTYRDVPWDAIRRPRCDT